MLLSRFAASLYWAGRYLKRAVKFCLTTASRALLQLPRLVLPTAHCTDPAALLELS